MHAVTIDSNGTVRFIYSDDLAAVLRPLGEQRVRRASHVEPTEDGRWTADMSPSAKVCRLCARILPLEQFTLRDGGARRRSDCKDCRLSRSTAWRRDRKVSDPEWRAVNAAKEVASHKSAVALRRIEVLIAYSSDPPSCACCGESGFEFLTIDHVDGNGAAHRKELRAQGVADGSGFYQWLKRAGYPAGYQVLCYNCNCAKGHYGTCPHKTGPVLGPYRTRAAALRHEVAWLRKNRLGA